VNVIEIENLSKNYGATRALDAATWTVGQGRCLGFLGPNGAGKTTTIRILLGFLKATFGRASVFGLDAWRQSARIRARVGYLPGDVQLYRHLTGRQIFDFVARARGIKDPNETNRLIDIFQLNPEVRVRECSKGMRQKIGLVAAMLHRPELLIFDEPTVGLDPLMRQALYRELRAAADRGATVFFSSHTLAEVEALCEDVVILRAGRVVASTTIESLQRQAGQRVHLRLAGDAPDALEYPDGFKLHRNQDRVLEGHYSGKPDNLTAWLANLPLAGVVIETSDLEDVFLAYYDEGD
jgi:ABC-2 type transport system ATP-binding protein